MGVVGLIGNKHLAKLWDFMVSYNCKSEEQPSDILKAFQECDEALSDVQNQCEHWKTMYGNACGDQDVLKESIRLLDTTNRRLEQKARDQEKEIMQRRKEADGLYKELDRLRDEKASLSYQKIRDQEKEIEELRKDNDVLERAIERNVDSNIVNNKTIYQLRKDNEKLGNELQDLQKEYDKLKNDSGYLRNSRDTWRSRAKHAEAEAAELAKKRDKLRDEHEELQKRLMETTDILEEINRDRNEWRRQALMTKLTSKLPDIKEEYTMTVTMDNADYNDLMKLLWNKAFGASPEYMRDFLKEFCDGHDSCRLCPLKECGSDFGRNFDSMSDEEIEKYYKIAIGAQPEKEKPDLKFGDIVKVPWSNNDYIFIEALTSSIRLYSITKRRFVIVAKNEHLKWVGHIKK